MSTPGDMPEETSRSAVAEPVPSGSRRPLRPRILVAAALLVVAVGGVALGVAEESLTAACVADPGRAALLGVPSCGGFLAAAVIAGAVCGVAVVAGLHLILTTALPRPKRLTLAAGVLVALLLVAAIPVAWAPTPATTGTAAQLAFPIPAGSVFNISSFGDAATQALVPASPYLVYAPILLVGAFNATEIVCLSVVQASGSQRGPATYGSCGTSTSFAFPVAPGAWIIDFYLPAGVPSALGNITVGITQPVEVVY